MPPSKIPVLLVVAVIALGCGDGATMGEPFPFQEMIEQGLARYLGVAEPVRSIPVGASTVHEFSAGDGPICLRGAPYRVATRRGSDENLVLYLQGGGACSSQICQVTNPTTESTLSVGVPQAGILSPSSSANPVRSWNVVFAPYCDGSLMAGDVEADDDGDGELDRYQRGLRNLSAALDMAVREFPNPPRILLTGISAGGFATMTALPLVRFLYPDAEILVVNDSGVGIASGRPGSLLSLAREWGSESSIPASCERCFATDQLMPLLGWQLDRDPNVRIGIITSEQDSVIAATFLQISGAEFETFLRRESDLLRARHPDRFKRFLFEGAKHTTLAIEADTDLTEAIRFTDIDPAVLDLILGRFDVTAVEGETVAEWVTAMVDGGSWVDRVVP